MKKNEIKTLEDMEEYFSKARRIYTHKEYKDYKELVSDMVNGKSKTFFKNGNKQARDGSFRSISDIIVACKTQFNTPVKDVIEYLDTFENSRNRCSVIRKYVFHPIVRPFKVYKDYRTEIGNMRYNDLIKLCQE